MPISIGTKGGVLQTSAIYQQTHYILGYPNSQELAEVIVAVGLACNFSAIKALVTEGIQKGHMSLHARNIAISAGVPNELVNEVVIYMKKHKDISQRCATEYLTAHHLHSQIHNRPHKVASFSTFLVELTNTQPPIRLNIAFLSNPILHIYLKEDMAPLTGIEREIQDKLLNAKGYNWLSVAISILNQVRIFENLERENVDIRNKLKVLGVLINIISHQLLKANFDAAKTILEAILDSDEARLMKTVA